MVRSFMLIRNKFGGRKLYLYQIQPAFPKNYCQIVSDQNILCRRGERRKYLLPIDVKLHSSLWYLYRKVPLWSQSLLLFSTHKIYKVKFTKLMWRAYATHKILWTYGKPNSVAKLVPSWIKLSEQRQYSRNYFNLTFQNSVAKFISKLVLFQNIAKLRRCL